MISYLNKKTELKKRAIENSIERLLDLIFPMPKKLKHISTHSDIQSNGMYVETREKLKRKIEEGKLDDRIVEISTSDFFQEELRTLEKKLDDLIEESIHFPKEIVGDIFWHPSYISANPFRQLILIVSPEKAKEFTDISKKIESFYHKKKVEVREALELYFKDEYKKLLTINEITEENFKLSLDPEEVEFIQRKLIEPLIKNPELIYKISHREFEELIQEILIKMGYYVDLTAQTRDGGCDLIAIKKDTLGIQTKYIIEAKHYRPPNKVGINIIRQVNTVKQKYRGHHGVIVTSSYFTKDAIEENDQFYGLHLKDYDNLLEWLRRIKFN